MSSSDDFLTWSDLDLDELLGDYTLTMTFSRLIVQSAMPEPRIAFSDIVLYPRNFCVATRNFASEKSHIYV